MRNDTIRNVICDAVEEVIEEAQANKEPLSARRLSNRVIKRLAENKRCVAAWVAELGVFKFVGYANKKNPTLVRRNVPYTRDNAPVYMTQESDE